MMKIRLVVSPSIRYPPELWQITHFDKFLPPYGIGCLKSFLIKHGYPVSLVDFSPRINDFKSHILYLDRKGAHQEITDYLIHGVPNQKLELFSELMFRGIADDKYGLIGFSVFSRLNLTTALLAAKRVKAKTGAPIVFGGALMTEYAESEELNKIQCFLKDFNFIDFVISGEGETPLLKLTEYLQGRASIEEVPNLIYRGRERIIINQRKLYDIEDMPVPNFEDLALDLYGKSASFNDKIELPYQITRGCTQKCSFCSFYLVSPRVQLKSLKKVIIELVELKDAYKTSCFFFCECRINISYGYLEELCDLIIKNKLNIKWRTVAGINNIDYKLLTKMRQAGCYCLTWGVESGSNRILKLMNKGFIAQEAEKVIKDSFSAGITNVINFITGFVTENDTDLCQTISFIKRNIKYIDRFRLFDFALIPNTPVFERPAEFGIKNVFLYHHSPLGFSYFGFDEIDGLEWKDLIKRKRRSYQRVYFEVRNIFLKKKCSDDKRIPILLKMQILKVFFISRLNILLYDWRALLARKHR